MKVGQRLDVFEVLPDNWYDDLKTGDWVTEPSNTEFHGNPYGVDVLATSGKNWKHLGLDGRKEARKVGTLIIKKIK